MLLHLVVSIESLLTFSVLPKFWNLMCYSSDLSDLEDRNCKIDYILIRNSRIHLLYTLENDMKWTTLENDSVLFCYFS